MAGTTRAHPLRHALRIFLAAYVVFGLIGSLLSLVLVNLPSPYSSSSSDDDMSSIIDDPADSWSRFNAGTDGTAPNWTADQFEAAVGDAKGGQIVRMPGARTVLDDKAITALTAGTNILVVVTPPNPLSAVETTRVRDNTLQKYWAVPKKLDLIMVHGQEAYLPGPDLFVLSTPGSGIPLRDSMRTSDATYVVTHVAKSAIAFQAGNKKLVPHNEPGIDAVTAQALALTGARAPTAAELTPITTALDAGNTYVDPSIKPAPTFDKKWAAIAPGKPMKVAILPYAPTGPPVDYTAALAKKYPDAAILVMTGKWIESAGVDRSTMIDALLQTYGLGGIALASSAPAYAEILDWVTGIYASATASHAFDRPLPTAPPVGIPRWVSFLILGTSLIVALGFLGEYLYDRRSRKPVGPSVAGWRHTVLGGLTSSYLTLAAAPALTADAIRRPDDVRQLLDDSYAGVLELQNSAATRGRQLDDDRQAIHAAWSKLDTAAGLLGRSDASPSSTMDASLATPPSPQPARQPKPSMRNVLRAKLSVALGHGNHQHPHRLRKWLWRLLAFVVFVVIAARVILSFTFTGVPKVDTSTLRTASAVITSPTSTATEAGLQKIIGNRALYIVVDDGLSDTTDQYNLGKSIAADYPNSVSFVIVKGEIEDAEIGVDARTPGYDVYSLIDDYYGLQSPTAGNDTALVRQLALLYDRLAGEGSIHGSVRGSYDPPRPPWIWIALGLVIAVVAAGFLIRLATRRAEARSQRNDDEQGRREALSLLLASTATRLLQAGATPTDLPALARFGGRQRELMDTIEKAPPAQFDAIEEQIEQFDGQVAEVTG